MGFALSFLGVTWGLPGAFLGVSRGGSLLSPRKDPGRP